MVVVSGCVMATVPWLQFAGALALVRPWTKSLIVIRNDFVGCHAAADEVAVPLVPHRKRACFPVGGRNGVGFADDMTNGAACL